MNSGVIAGNSEDGFGAGIVMLAGGSVTNQAASTISGYRGVILRGGGSVTNQAGGMISGADGAVEIDATGGMWRTISRTVSSGRQGSNAIKLSAGRVCQQASRE